MQGDTQLNGLLKPVVEALGYELVGVERFPRHQETLLRVYIDSVSGVTVDDCARVSHQVSGVLEVENVIRGHYILEISSPGLDRPLFSLEHFQRFINRQIKVELSTLVEGRRKIVGTIVGVEDQEVILREAENNKDYRIPFNRIGKARLVPQLD
jgi:ribosome maturation factor RimP